MSRSGKSIRRTAAAGFAAALLLAFVGQADAQPSTANTSVCPASVRSWVNTLAEINGRLAVSITYAKYGQLITNAEIDFSKMSISGLTQLCRGAVVVPAAKAMDAYNTAYASWTQCNNNPSVGNCKGGPGNAFRQRYWATAQNEINIATDIVGLG